MHACKTLFNLRAWMLALVCLSGCASGQDGLKQACANTDAVLTGAYQLDTATMKTVIALGKSKTYLHDFEVATASLDAAAATKATACAASASDSKGWADLVSKVLAAGADATAAIGKLVAVVKGGQ